jgi:hypothetical protein
MVANEVRCFLGCGAVQSERSFTTFRKNFLPVPYPELEAESFLGKLVNNITDSITSPSRSQWPAGLRH